MLIQKIANFFDPYVSNFIKYYKSCNEIDKVVLGIVIVVLPSGIVCAIINFGLSVILSLAALYFFVICLFYLTGKGNE